MTESLSDGPDWHLRTWSCSCLSLFSTVDEWSGSSIRVHRKAFRAIELLAYHRRLSLWRIYSILWHKLWPLHASALHHWHFLPSSDFSMSSRFPIQWNSILFCWSCALTLRSRQQILLPQVSTLMQAGTYFPKVRRMLFYVSPFILTHFWPASTLLRVHLALATLSLLVNDPQILERWGCADEVHLGKYIRAKDLCLEF